MRTLFIISALILGKLLPAQEFLVTVNPATALPAIIDTINEVQFVQGKPAFSTFDHVHNKYFFLGMTYSGQTYFYSINALNGAIIKRIAPPSLNNPYTNVGNIQFEDSTGFIYATGNVVGKQDLYLLKMDTSSAVLSTVCALPGASVALTNQSTFDQVNRRYMCITTSTSSVPKINVLDCTTGSLTASSNITVFNISPSTFRYNSKTQKLYAIMCSPSSGPPRALVEFNPLTAAVINTVTPFMLLFDASDNPNYCSIDEINNRYTYYFSNRLGTINLSTGVITYSPLCNSWAVPSPQFDNVIEYHYSHSNGNLYALHWKYVAPSNVGINETSLPGKLIFYPNPSKTNITLSFASPQKEVTLHITDALGRLVYTDKLPAATEHVISTAALPPPGVYAISVTSGEGNRLSGILIRE